MVSILIPCYNYNIDNLISQLHAQCLKTTIHFEIICCNDGSNSFSFSEQIQGLTHVTLLTNNQNIGRTETRQKLALKAHYDWLLFLDADVIPLYTNFISIYINTINHHVFDICYGGLVYDKIPPSSSLILRWKYGQKKEVINYKTRNKHPFKTLPSANLLIKKNIFIATNARLKGNFYGYDNIFSSMLKEQKHTALHINNPVIHKGLETAKEYLQKKEAAAETLLKLFKNNQITSKDNKLLNSYIFIKNNNLQPIIKKIFKLTKPYFVKNILSKNPSVTILNIYRLGYLCSLN